MKYLVAGFLVSSLVLFSCGKGGNEEPDVLVGSWKQLTFRPGQDDVDQPVWSPDGTKIAYREKNNIYVVPVEGEHPQPYPVTEWEGMNQFPSWNPDPEANELCFISYIMSKYRLIRIKAVENENDTTLVYTTENQIMYSNFTHDGKNIVYYRPPIPSDSTNLVWSIPIDGGQPQPIPNNEKWGRIFGLKAATTSNDIIYIDRKGYVPNQTSGYFNVKLLPLAGGNPTNLTNYVEGSPYSIGGVAMSHDGKKLALTLYDNSKFPTQFELWTMDLSTGELTKITNDSWGNVSSPTWSPDDTKIAVIRYRNIFIIDLNG